MPGRKHIRKTPKTAKTPSRNTIPAMPVFISLFAMFLVYIIGNRMYSGTLSSAGRETFPAFCSYDGVDISDVAGKKCLEEKTANVCLSINGEVDFSLSCEDEDESFSLQSCNRCQSVCDLDSGLCEEDLEY